MTRAEFEAAWQATNERFDRASLMHRDGSRYSTVALVCMWTGSVVVILPRQLEAWVMPVLWSVALASIIVWLVKTHVASKQADIALREQRDLLAVMRHVQDDE